MLLSASLLAAFSFIGSATAQSLYIWNNCGGTVWAQQVYDSVSNVYAINAQDGTFAGVPPIGTGTAVNFYTGCSDNTATDCTTGGVNSNSGQTPFIRGEVTWSSDSLVYYDISPLYGYNMALKINTNDENCPGIQCNINSGCPVPGPDGSCYAPCCDSADGCLGTNNCPYDSIYNNNYGGPGVYSSFYHDACPNAYSFPDDDCSNYGDSPLASCGDNGDVTMTLCPNGVSSNYNFC